MRRQSFTKLCGLLEGFMAPMKSESDLPFAVLCLSPFSILGSCAEWPLPSPSPINSAFPKVPVHAKITGQVLFHSWHFSKRINGSMSRRYRAQGRKECSCRKICCSVHMEQGSIYPSDQLKFQRDRLYEVFLFSLGFWTNCNWNIRLISGIVALRWCSIAEQIQSPN